MQGSIDTGDAAQEAAAGDDTVLQSAVWMAEDLGIDMPPVPGVYAETLEEIGLGQIFATDRSILDCDSPGGIMAALDSGWPASGLGFGYAARGSGGRWFYTLISEKIILHVSLRLQHVSPETSRISLGEVSTANRRLDAYLSNETNYFNAISTDAPADGRPRRIVVYSDMDGLAREFHASWSVAEGLRALEERREVFSDTSTEPLAVEQIIWV